MALDLENQENQDNVGERQGRILLTVTCHPAPTVGRQLRVIFRYLLYRIIIFLLRKCIENNPASFMSEYLISCYINV